MTQISKHYLLVTTKKNLIDYKTSKISLLYLYFGALTAMIFYNLFIYFNIKDNNYLLYVAFVLFYLLAQVEHNAFPNDIFTSKSSAFVFATAHIFWVAFHTLFSIKLLSIKDYYPRLGKYFLWIGYLLLANGFYGLYDLEIAIRIVLIFMLFLPFALLFTAIKLHQKKNKLAIFYIIAQTLFLISSFIFGLLYGGAIEYNNFTRNIHFVGSFSEIILFSFALAYKTRLVMEENEKNKDMLNDYSKLTYMGETMVSIYHQWKSPVNNIYNHITHIETAKEFNDKNINQIIDTNLEKIKLNTQYLKNTATEFLKMNNVQSSVKEPVVLFDEIESVLNLMEGEFKKNHVEIISNIQNNIVINTHKNQLRNLFLILIENAIKTFKGRGIKNPTLNIETLADESNITIVVEDNAGGVTEKPIDKIFERYHSATDSSGIGLYLAKYVLMVNLNGEIRVENTEKGSRFTITLL